MMKRACVILFCCVPLLACQPDYVKEIPDLSTVQVNEFSIVELPYLEKPYIREDYISTTIQDFDQDSVPVIIIEGNVYYNPVFTSLYGIRYVDAFIRSGDYYYLDLATRIASKLVEKSLENNQNLLFPYNFDFSYSADDNLTSPWYSGMAQGRMLTFFVRMYQVTEDEKYLTWADQTFETFKLLKGKDKNWVGFIDNNNYYWIEEYPSNEPIHVLNGFIYAIYGLYDYYLETNDEECLKLLYASLTTIEKYIEEYRNPDEVSSYDLKNRFQNENYHPIHIAQLNKLYQITENGYFKEIADLFANDF